MGYDYDRYRLPHNCIDCGKEHYTQYVRGKARHLRCRSCAISLSHKGHTTSAETRAKISVALMGHSVSEKVKIGHPLGELGRLKLSLARQGKPSSKKGKHYPLSPETRQRISLASKRMWNSDGFREKFSLMMKGKFAGEKHPSYGKHRSPETIKKMADGHRGKPWSKNMRRLRKEQCANPEFRKRQSEIMKAIRADPNSVFNSAEYRRTLKKPRHFSAETIAKRVDRCMRYIKTKALCNYNKQERRLDEIIQRVLPNQYGYNGGTQLGFRIHYHTPDFVNIDGQKKIIELHGCQWHCCEECGITRHPVGKPAEVVRARDKKNVEDAERLGFKVLVIWEHELKEEAKVVEKLLAFSALEIH